MKPATTQQTIDKNTSSITVPKTWEWFNTSITNNHLKILAIYCAVIIMLEILAYKQVVFAGFLASRLWMIGWLICAVTIIAMFVKSLVDDIRQKQIFTLVAIACFIFVLVFTLGDISKLAINHESASQLVAGLDSFSMPNWNFTGQAFLGYPARQYLIVSIPTLFFGHTIFSMVLGFAFPFYLGLMLTYLGIRKYTQNSGFAITALSAMWLFPYMTAYYIYFEQTLIPVAFTFQAIGWFLLLMKKPTFPVAFGLLWVCAFFSNMYTPGAIALLLFIALFAIIAISSWFDLKKFKLGIMRIQDMDKKHSFLLCSLLAVFPVIIAGIGFILGKQNSNLTISRNPSIAMWFDDIKISLKAFFLNDGTDFTGYIALIIIFFMVLALSTRIGATNTMIALWVLGVIAASCLFTGYATPHGRVTLFRALTTIPVILTAIAMTIYHYLKNRNFKIKTATLAVIMAVNLLVGVYYMSQPYVQVTPEYFIKNEIPAMPRFIMNDMEKVGRKYKIDHTASIVVAVEDGLSDGLTHYLEYTYPHANYILFNADEGLPDDIDLTAGAIVYMDANSVDATPLPDDMKDTYEFYVKNGKSADKPIKLAEGEVPRVAVRKVLPPVR